MPGRLDDRGYLLEHGSVTVGLSAVLAEAASLTRREWTGYNVGPGNIYPGTSSVSSSNTIPAAVGDYLIDDGNGDIYLVSTANMTSAPTCVFNRHTMPGGTGTGFVAVTTTPAPTMTYAGVDTVGTAFGAGAAGSHIAVATLATPYTLVDTDALIATYTMNESATTVLDIFGIRVTYV